MTGLAQFHWSLLLLIPLSVNTQTMSDSETLIKTLLSSYEKLVRPAEDQSYPVIVNMTFDLVSVQGFDEVAEKLSVVGILYISWYEPRMRWNPLTNGNIISVNIPETYVWKPGIIIANPTKTMTAIGKDWLNVRYYANGLAFWSPGDFFEITCAVDVQYYPFDIQKCDINIVAWGTLTSEVYLNAATNEVLKSYFSENGEWIVADSVARSIDLGTTMMFQVALTLERRPIFFLVNVVLPIIFMGFLNVLVFLLPAESGERISYAITVLLAIAVFLTLVGDNMPKTSKPMSVLCYFLVTQLILSALICVAAIINLRLFFKSNKNEVPHWLTTLTRKLRCMPQEHRTRVQHLHENQGDQEADSVKGINIIQLEPKHAAWTDNVMQANEDISQDITWRDVSHMIDILLCFVSLLWMSLSVGSFIFMIATRSVPDEITV